jgi:hypothetical protein
MRFGIGTAPGRRSSEWLVMWKPRSSDVYLASRTLGGVLKASIHESGKCHIRAPNPSAWVSPGSPPPFVDKWTIEPRAAYAFPFAVIVPELELRQGEWKQHRDKGTFWLNVEKGKTKEVARFLVREQSDQRNALAQVGWKEFLLDTVSGVNYICRWRLSFLPVFGPYHRSTIGRLTPKASEAPFCSEHI